MYTNFRTSVSVKSRYQVLKKLELRQPPVLNNRLPSTAQTV